MQVIYGNDTESRYLQSTSVTINKTTFIVRCGKRHISKCFKFKIIIKKRYQIRFRKIQIGRLSLCISRCAQRESQQRLTFVMNAIVAF